jgi:RimJ/RimL family protein N-acetyltransferase
MTRLTAPTQPLSDGVITLRLPSIDAGDADAVTSYLEEDRNDGTWLPLLPGGGAEASVRDWLEGWAGHQSHNGASFVVEIADEQRFVGIVGVGEPRDGSVEMIVGIALRWRGRGLGSRAVRLGASWLLGLPEMSAAELRIDKDMIDCQHVARNAGFSLAGTVSQFVPATGETLRICDTCESEQRRARNRPRDTRGQ